MGLLSEAGQNPGDLMMRVARLEQELDQLRYARRLEAAAVGSGGIRLHDGGSLRLQGGGSVQVEGGEVVVRDSDGNVQVRIARNSEGGGQIVAHHPNGTSSALIGDLTFNGVSVGHGFLFQKADGTDVLGGAPTRPGGPVVVIARDDSGAIAVSTDDGGRGLDRPWLEVPLYQANSLRIRVAESTFTTVWQGRMWITHPALHVHARGWCSPGDTGQVRVLVSGNRLGGVHSIDDSTSFIDFGNQNLNIDDHPLGSFQNVQLQARLVGGSGGEPSGSEHATVIPYGVTKRGSN